jgi:hypothetical protein
MAAKNQFRLITRDFRSFFGVVFMDFDMIF